MSKFLCSLSVCIRKLLLVSRKYQVFKLQIFSIISTSKSDEELLIDDNFDGKQRPERISVICANPQWKKEERMSRDEMNLRLSGLQTMEILLEIEKVAKKYCAKLKKF